MLEGVRAAALHHSHQSLISPDQNIHAIRIHNVTDAEAQQA